MEKPPVTSKEQLDLLSEAVRGAEQSSKAQLGICFQNRYNKSVQYVHRILEEKRYGAVKSARRIVSGCRDEAYYRNSDCRGRLDKECGGALINQISI